jgi:hypothetical protein
MSRLGPVVKNVAEVRVTSIAQNLDPSHSIAVVNFGSDLSFSYRRPKAWPSCARIEFCLRAEEVVTAGYALVDSIFVQIPILAV